MLDFTKVGKGKGTAFAVPDFFIFMSGFEEGGTGRYNKANIEWGSQIRSYVFMPYTLAKDTRTGFEDGNIDSVMDGNIDGFINAYLKQLSKEEGK